jgi:hypothetical protein
MARGRRIRETTRGARVTECKIDAPRPLVTFSEEDLDVHSFVELVQTRRLKGAIVRLKPPPDLDDATLAEMRDAILERGAEFVTALPRRKKAVVPDEAVERPTRARATARQVVLELVASSNARSREDLGAYCEELMSREGV